MGSYQIRHFFRQSGVVKRSNKPYVNLRFQATVDPGQTRTEILTLLPQLYNINSLNQDE